MSTIYGFTTLNDAYAFLLEAKGLPAVASSTVRKQRCVRACILLSWISLEDGLDTAIECWEKNGKTFGCLPSSLKQRLSSVLNAVSRPGIDENEFAALRCLGTN